MHIPLRVRGWPPVALGSNSAPAFDVVTGNARRQGLCRQTRNALSPYCTLAPAVSQRYLCADDNMNSAPSVRDQWGGSHFVLAPATNLARLELSEPDSWLLSSVGLPVSPASALRLYLRFETVNIHHQPATVGLLSETNFERTRFYPLTGDPDVDVWARLDRFVVLGEAPNDFGRGSYFSTRLVCLDAISGKVAWLHPAPDADGRSRCCVLNTSLSAYLGSLLAYRRFKDQAPHLEEVWNSADESSIDSEYRPLATRVHTELLRDLEAADPDGFSGGFWESHAWDEAILLEI